MTRADGALPGDELVQVGLRDLERGVTSVEALLLCIARPRLERLGMHVPPSATDTAPELRLYRALRAQRPRDAYGYYNSLLRRLTRYARALEQRQRHGTSAVREGLEPAP